MAHTDVPRAEGDGAGLMVIYESMAEAAESLPPDEQAWLYRAAVRFVEYGEEPDGLSMGQSLVFASHRQALEKQRRRMTDKETGMTTLQKRMSERVNPSKQGCVLEGSTHKNTPPVSKGADRREEKISEDKKREEKRYASSEKRDEVIDYFNGKTGMSIKKRHSATTENLEARLNDGFTVDDCKVVIDSKMAEWWGDDRMRKYVRLTTLFAPSHFESYLNTARTSGAASTIGVNANGETVDYSVYD